MQPDRSTLIGQVIAGIASLLIGGFILFKIIQAIAALFDALEGRPEKPAEDKDEDDDEDK